MKKTALIVIDVQNDYFPGGLWTLHNMEAVARNVALLLEHARKNNVLVVHIRHEFTTEDAPFFKPGSKGAEIHPSVINLPDEHVVLKHYINSYLKTDLKEHLDKHKIEALIICGAMSHMCVDAATRASADYGYPVCVIHDACASRNLEFNGVTVPAELVHNAFMSALGFAYADMKSTQEFLSGK